MTTHASLTFASAAPRLPRAGPRWRRWGSRLALLAVLPAAACDGASQDKDPDAAAALRLTEELRIGTVEGGTADAFGRVAALDADGAGRIYVADGLSKDIRVFGSDGRHVRTLGREGSGPGEFRIISGMARSGDGRLWVMDPASSRLTVYDTTGALLATLRLELSLATTIPWLGGVDQAGNIYDSTRETTAPRSAAGPRSLLVRYGPEGDHLAATDTLPLPTTKTDMFEGRTSGGIRFFTNVPFSPSQRWRLAPDGSVWTGVTSSYRLDRVSFDGDTLAVLRHARRPVPVSHRERDSLAAAEGVPADRIPAVKPAFRSFLVDPAGRVWVEPYLPGGSGTEWDVFSASGTHLGLVRTALDLETEEILPIVRGDHLYAVTRDETDVPYIVRMRVPALPS